MRNWYSGGGAEVVGNDNYVDNNLVPLQKNNVLRSIFMCVRMRCNESAMKICFSRVQQYFNACPLAR